MGNCNSSKKRDLQKAKSLKSPSGAASRSNASGNISNGASAANNKQSPHIPTGSLPRNAQLDAAVNGAGIMQSNSYTDRKLKEKELFKNIIERTQQKLIDVSQSPGGILDWADEEEESPQNGTSQNPNASKLRHTPHIQLSKELFSLDHIQDTNVEDLVNMELIRPEEIDMMVEAMRLQEGAFKDMNLKDVGELVIPLRVQE